MQARRRPPLSESCLAERRKTNEMSNLPIYEMLAQAFASEGIDTLFNLMGDGNMHWATAMSKIDGMQVFHARHEHCATMRRIKIKGHGVV
jgi:hypothetical protein